MAGSALWGVLCTGQPGRDLRPWLELLYPLTSYRLLLTNDIVGYAGWPINLLRPRYPASGNLGAWLSLWQDSSAPAVIWLDIDQPRPTLAQCRALSECLGKVRIATVSSMAAFYERSCLGPGLRLWRQGGQDLAILAKMLRAPDLE